LRFFVCTFDTLQTPYKVDTEKLGTEVPPTVGRSHIDRDSRIRFSSWMQQAANQNQFPLLKRFAKLPTSGAPLSPRFSLSIFDLSLPIRTLSPEITADLQVELSP